MSSFSPVQFWLHGGLTPPLASVLFESPFFQYLIVTSSNHSLIFILSILFAGGTLGMGIREWIWGTGVEDDVLEESVTDGGEALFDDESDPEADVLGDFDELEDWDDEELAGLDEEDSPDSDLTPRLDEVENEIESLSSTMSTIRSEHQEISESVQDIEENIRKLLDIYELVTRGVNPFVDDVQQGGLDANTFGLFENADGDAEDDADIDEDLANADPESFFDEEFDEADATAADSFLEQFENGDELGDGIPFDDEDSVLDEDTDDAEGKTFEELKSEYEAGTADWLSDDSDADNPDGDDVHLDFEGETRHEDETGDDSLDGAQEAVANEPEGDERIPTDVETDSDTAADVEPDGDLRFAENTMMASSASDTDKPYLVELPNGYVSDLIVMEWLTYLLDNADMAETLGAIQYYEDIGWLADPAATNLRTYLTRLDRPTKASDSDSDSGRRPSKLSVDDHTTSLKYISRLANSATDVGAVTGLSEGR